MFCILCYTKDLIMHMKRPFSFACVRSELRTWCSGPSRAAWAAAAPVGCQSAAWPAWRSPRRAPSSAALRSSTPAAAASVRTPSPGYAASSCSRNSAQIFCNNTTQCSEILKQHSAVLRDPATTRDVSATHLSIWSRSTSSVVCVTGVSVCTWAMRNFSLASGSVRFMPCTSLA